MKSSILKTHENCQESISLTLRTRSSKKPSRTHVRSWKHQWLLLCFARHATKASMRRPVARQMISSLNLRVSWKSLNPQECVWKNLNQIIMRTILQEERTIHCIVTIWYTDLFLCSKPWKFLQQGQQWINNGRNLEKISAWNLTKVRSKKEVIDEARTKGRKVHFASLIDICHLKNAELETQAPKIQRKSCASRRHCERWFGILCSIHWTRIISITNDSSKSHGYHLQTARLRWTSSRCSICWNPGQNGRCSQIVENSQVGVSRHLDLSTTTQMAEILLQYGRPSRSSWTKSVWSSFGRTVMEKAIWENPHWNTVARRFPIGNAYAYIVKRIILICVCG